MTSLADERFRRLHEQFLDAAQTYPNLFFAAAMPVHPEGTLWTETLANIGGTWCRFPGLEPYRWYELLDKPFYPLKPACDRWLSMEGHLWHGVFYGPGPKLQPNGQEDRISAENYRRVCESGIELFDSLARQAAAYCALPTRPDEILMRLNRYAARLAFHDCQRVENRWLEKLCNLPTAIHVETELSMFKWQKRLKQGETSNSDSDQPCERYWEAYKLRRFPCDVFTASALAIEDPSCWLNEWHATFYGQDGASPTGDSSAGRRFWVAPCLFRENSGISSRRLRETWRVALGKSGCSTIATTKRSWRGPIWIHIFRAFITTSRI